MLWQDLNVTVNCSIYFLLVAGKSELVRCPSELASRNKLSNIALNLPPKIRWHFHVLLTADV